MGHMARGIGSISVGAVLKRVVRMSIVFTRGRHTVQLRHCIEWQQVVKCNDYRCLVNDAATNNVVLSVTA